MAIRFDAIRLDSSKVTRLPNGNVRVPAVVTRSGVFGYMRADGSMVYEWRPPEEVLKAESLQSLRDATVTDRHPKEMVSPENSDRLSIGYASGEPRKDDATHGAAIDIVVSRKDAIPRVGKDLCEVSCGYGLRIDTTPGVVPAGYPDAGKRYDAVQRDIIYNHVALGPVGWGRQGSSVSLRLDSSDNEIVEIERDVRMKLKIKRADGSTVEVEAGSQEHIEIEAEKDAALVSARKDATDAKEAAETLKGENAALTSKLAAEAARADAAPAKAAEALKARASLEATAGKALGADVKLDGKSDREVKIAVIQHYDSAFTGKDESGKDFTEDRIDGAFSVWTSSAAPAKAARKDSLLLGLNGRETNGTERKDGVDEKDTKDPAVAEQGMLKRYDSAGKARGALSIRPAGE